MNKRIPSISSLLAFEASARYLSFTRAAIELNLTQTAISHQIKNLEELLETNLFIRNASGLILTEKAKDYLVSVREAIIILSSASDHAGTENQSNILTVECLGAFAIKKLIPNLHKFRAIYPEIEIRLNTIHTLHDIFKRNFDVGIWHGLGKWNGLDCESLGPEEVFPVCSPNLLKSNLKLETPEDLKNYTMIRSSCPVLGDEWPFWLEAAGYTNMEFNSSINCDYFITNIQCAIDSLGVTLGRSSVVQEDLKKGILIEPFNIRTTSINSYQLVSPYGVTNTPKVQLFKKWVLENLKTES
jgi:LysR family glycine cleavage system transcriptional activator